MNQYPILPLLIQGRDGVLAYLLANPKSYEKSIETNEIWYVHPTTLRVLSLPQSQGCPIRFTGTHYEANWTQEPAPTLPPMELDSTVTPEPTSKGGLGFLEELTQIIRARRQTLPEGSYTTHLFQKGEAKIRKKTGEEAVELILSQTPQELVSEAADLVYHLMVLLEVNDLDLIQVVEVLERRHR